jgi:hypothetical protein
VAVETDLERHFPSDAIDTLARAAIRESENVERLHVIDHTK